MNKGASKKSTTSIQKKNLKVNNKKITILIYCTSELILSGILRMTETAQDMKVIDIQKTTIDVFLESIKKLSPHVILFTNSEPMPNIREICKAIKEIAGESTKYQQMLLGNIPSHEEVVGLMNSGVRGYFDLNDPSNQLTEAIRAVYPTEFQVLRLIGQGKSNDEIAEAMFISKNTVRSHIKSIYAKFDTHSRLQLALYAINSALF
jgi:NarL family two-component system response regulator LiaR